MNQRLETNVTAEVLQKSSKNITFFRSENNRNKQHSIFNQVNTGDKYSTIFSRLGQPTSLFLSPFSCGL